MKLHNSERFSVKRCHGGSTTSRSSFARALATRTHDTMADRQEQNPVEVIKQFRQDRNNKQLLNTLTNIVADPGCWECVRDEDIVGLFVDLILNQGARKVNDQDVCSFLYLYHFIGMKLKMIIWYITYLALSRLVATFTGSFQLYGRYTAKSRRVRRQTKPRSNG